MNLNLLELQQLVDNTLLTITLIANFHHFEVFLLRKNVQLLKCDYFLCSLIKSMSSQINQVNRLNKPFEDIALGNSDGSNNSSIKQNDRLDDRK